MPNGNRKNNNRSSAVRYYGRRAEDVMHGLTVNVGIGQEKLIDIEVSDDMVCRSGMCDHDEKGIEHASGDRVSRVVICEKVPKFARNLVHEVTVGAKPIPVEVLQTPGHFDLRCCQKQVRSDPVPGERRRLIGTAARSPTDPDMHILGLLNAMGRVKVRNRPEMLRHVKPSAKPLPAPSEVLDPRTLQDDTPSVRPFLPRVDMTAMPPSNRAKLRIADGVIEYDGPEGETSRLLARNSRRLADPTRPARFVLPEDAFDSRIIMVMVLEAGPNGVTEHDIYQARVEELGPDVILDEPLSLAYLEKLRPAVDERLRKVGKTLTMDQQRLREGGTVTVLVGR